MKDKRPMSEFGFSVRTVTCLNSTEPPISTLEQLASKSIVDLLHIKGLGRVCLKEIRIVLRRHGLALKGDRGSEVSRLGPPARFGMEEGLKVKALPEGFIELPSAAFRPAVYALVDKGEIVYVGQSVSPSARIRTHLADKAFTQVFILPTAAAELSRVEGELIRALRPVLNSTLPDHHVTKVKA